MVMVATSLSFSGLVRNITWALLAIMMVLLGIALRNQEGYRYALLLQIGYYAALFVAILISTYS
jgi:hypothetical protein